MHFQKECTSKKNAFPKGMHFQKSPPKTDTNQHSASLIADEVAAVEAKERPVGRSRLLGHHIEAKNNLIAILSNRYRSRFSRIRFLENLLKNCKLKDDKFLICLSPDWEKNHLRKNYSLVGANTITKKKHPALEPNPKGGKYAKFNHQYICDFREAVHLLLENYIFEV